MKLRRLLAALALLLLGTDQGQALLFRPFGGAPGGGGGGAPANQIVVTDESGSGETNYPYQFGRPFIEGAIPVGAQGAQGTASIANGVMTASTPSSGAWAVGQVVTGTGAVEAPIIASLGSGTGGAGTYNLNEPNINAASATLTGSAQQCPVMSVSGTGNGSAANQFDIKNTYPDGSVKFGVGAVLIPAIPASGSVTISFAPGACNNAPLSVATMQGSPYNFDAHINLTIPPRIAGNSTPDPTCASWTSITNGEFVVNSTTVGPINFSNASSACTSLGNPSAFAIIQADINKALPAGMWLTNSVNGVRYFQLTGTAGTSSLTFLTSPSGGTDISGMLNLTSGGALNYNLSSSAPTVSAKAMLTAAGSCSTYSSVPALCRRWTSGPVAQTIILRDDSAAAAYDIGNGDGHTPFRPGFQATFWPGLGQVFVRVIGDNDNIAQQEDLDYGVTLTLGATSPTTLYTSDLSGTGEIFNEGVTGLVINQTVGPTFQGSVAISGTPSSSLTVGNFYSAVNLNTDEWFSFKYLSSTSVSVQSRGEIGAGPFGGTSNQLTVGDPIVVSSAAVNWMMTRWTKTGWIGTSPTQQVNEDQSLVYLEYTRFVPHYDPALVLASGAAAATYFGIWSQYPHNFYDATWDSGSEVFAYMENVGARPDIGPAPLWNAFSLESHGDWRMRQVDQGLADLYAEEPFQMRESVAAKRLLRSDTPGASTGLGHVFSISDRKSITAPFYNGATADNPVITGVIDSSQPFQTSSSHQPDPYYTPYVLYGDPFYLDQMYLWDGFNIAAIGSAIRGPTGDYESKMFSVTSGERTIAWAIRSGIEPAFIAPDTDPEKTYFTYTMNDAIAVFEGSLAISTDANYNTTPPYTFGVSQGDIQVTGGGPNDGVDPPLGNWSNNGCNPDDGVGTCGGTINPSVDAAFGWATGAVGSFDSQFMLYYLEYELGRAAELGFQIGPVLTHSGAWLIGLINNSGWPWEIQNEWIPDEPVMPPVVGQLSSWSAIGAMFQPGWLAPGGGQETQFTASLAAGTEGYAAYASAGTSELTGLTGGPAAWTWVQTTIQQVIPWGSVLGGAGLTTWTGDPTWDMTPCSPCQTLPAQPTAIPASNSPQ